MRYDVLRCSVVQCGVMCGVAWRSVVQGVLPYCAVFPTPGLQ